MSAGKLNIVVEQGATFERKIFLTDSVGAPVNLTGASVASQMRRDYVATEKVTFTMTIIDAVGGEINWVLPAATSAAIIPTDPTRRAYDYVYDVEVTYADTTVERILEGSVKVTPEVTRP